MKYQTPPSIPKMMAQAIPNSGPGSGIPPGQGKTREDMPKAVRKDKENMTKTKDKDKRQGEEGEDLKKTRHCVRVKTKDHKRIPLGYFKRKTILALFVDHYIISTE